jgi:anti-anti-sigma factor
MYIETDGPANTPGILTLNLDHHRADVAVVHASGCLDHRTAPDLQRALDEQVAEAPWAIVIDLSALSILKTDAVPSLVHVAYRAGEADIGMCLVTADSAVTEALAAAGVAELFEIYPTAEAALRALS